MAMRGRGTWLQMFLSCRQGQFPPLREDGGPNRRWGWGRRGGRVREGTYITQQEAASKAQKSQHMPPHACSRPALRKNDAGGTEREEKGGMLRKKD